jgi:hypothetical protein
MGRTFALLVMLLQMFMPPSMCICQLVPCGFAQQIDAGVIADISGSNDLLTKPQSGRQQASKHSCAACKKPRLEYEQNNGASPSGFESLQSSGSENSPFEHLPNCPIVEGGYNSRQIILHQSYSEIVLWVLPVLSINFFDEPARIKQYYPKQYFGASFPIYLKLLTLLI